MSVIAWDGRILAADQQCSFSNLRAATTKIWRCGNRRIGISGSADVGAAMRQWLAAGGDPEKFPKLQSDNNEFCAVLVVESDGSLWRYERTPYPIPIRERQFAIGSGCDFALAAMYLGRNAVEAVDVARHFDRNCGIGVDWLTLDGANTGENQ